jgi:hypothetical protein
MDLLPFIEAVGMYAQQGRAALEASALGHQRDDAPAELGSI